MPDLEEDEAAQFLVDWEHLKNAGEVDDLVEVMNYLSLDEDLATEGNLDEEMEIESQ